MSQRVNVAVRRPATAGHAFRSEAEMGRPGGTGRHRGKLVAASTGSATVSVADSHGAATTDKPAPMTPFALRALLKELRAGARIQPAAALLGSP